jgi:hypothetical protein
MTPDISAETWLGAAGWARGSHTWSGMIPALEPKPRSASRNTALRVVGESADAAVRRSPNAVVGAPAARSRKAASTSASPACVMATYHPPARMVSDSSVSVRTRKYDVRDMPSHIRRKVSTLAAQVTRLMVSRNRFSMAPRSRSEYRPSYAAVYPTP